MKSRNDDPFDVLVLERESDDFTELSGKPMTSAPHSVVPLPGVVVARLHGFDLDERPLLAALPDLPDEVVAARSTVALESRDVGRSVLLVFEAGDLRRPIVIGVLQDGRPAPRTRRVSVDESADCVEIRAERELVLSCGEASITLTRAGKVIIKGNYVISRSRGVNKIKGAAVDIN